MFDSLLNPIFGPLLKLPTLWVVVIISALISLIITVIYKLMTDQNLMKQLKQEMKELQKEMKELRDKPEKMMEVQKKAMQTNSKYMMQSMKSTLITFIPIILIFGWMNANIAFEPLSPGAEFTVDAMFNKGAFGEIKMEAPEGIEIVSNSTQKITNNQATWVLKGEKGSYVNENALKFIFNERVEYKDVVITDEQEYAPATKSFRNSPLRTVQINNSPKKVLDIGFGFLGYRGGWLGTYIIISILTSMLLRKLLKVY